MPKATATGEDLRLDDDVISREIGGNRLSLRWCLGHCNPGDRHAELLEDAQGLILVQAQMSAAEHAGSPGRPPRQRNREHGAKTVKKRRVQI